MSTTAMRSTVESDDDAALPLPGMPFLGKLATLPEEQGGENVPETRALSMGLVRLNLGRDNKDTDAPRNEEGRGALTQTASTDFKYLPQSGETIAALYEQIIVPDSDAQGSREYYKTASFEVLDKIVEELGEPVFALGLALKEIWERGLHKESYRSFDAYIKEKVQYSRAYVYQLMGAAEDAERLYSQPYKNLPRLKPGHIIPLHKLEVDVQIQIIELAVKLAQAKTLTVSHIKKAKIRVLGPEKAQAYPSMESRVSSADKFEKLIQKIEAVILSVEIDDTDNRYNFSSRIEALLILLNGN